MDDTGRDPDAQLSPLPEVVGEWWLRGLADAYAAHWAAAPSGPAGEQYMRGYGLGLALVRDMYFAALMKIERQEVAVPLEC